MIKLSAIIITFNEEHNIERCIKSIQDIADEIIVVDSLSSDNTVDIASNLGAKIYIQAFLGHKEQKIFAASKVSYQHILSLDADEVVSDTLMESILAIKKNWISETYSVKRLNNYCGKWITTCGWYPDINLRLWKKGAAIWTGQNPHDKLVSKDGRKPALLNGDLLHYTYNSISEHFDQMNYFSEIAAKAKYAEGEKASFVKLLVSPVFRFMKSFIVKRGFTDGYIGFIISRNQAYETFLKYAKLYMLHKNNGKV